MQQLQFNPAQYELINLLSCVDKEEDIVELKEVIVQFLNRRLQREIDKQQASAKGNRQTLGCRHHQ